MLGPSLCIQKKMRVPPWDHASHRYWIISAQTISAQDSSAQIILLGLLGTALSGNKECYILKRLRGSIKIKRNVRECHKEPGSITNKSTVREYNNKKNAYDYHNQE